MDNNKKLNKGQIRIIDFFKEDISYIGLAECLSTCYETLIHYLLSDTNFTGNSEVSETVWQLKHLIDVLKEANQLENN